MELRDWALITFTILVQMSVGSFWVLILAHLFAARKHNVQEADRLTDRAFYVLLPIIVVGFLGSLLHLGDPLHAYRAVSNLGTSWLSREILTGVIFGGLAFLYAFLQWRKIGSNGLRMVFAWLAAIDGLALVYSMSNVYMLPSQPAWNSLATPVSFFVTAFLLGSLAMGAAFAVNYGSLKRKQPDCAEVQCGLMREALKSISVAAIALLGVEVVVLPLYLATLAGNGAAGLASVKMMIGSFGWMLALRVVLAFIAAGILGLFLFRNAIEQGRERILANVAVAAFVLMLVAEVLGRLIFYAAHVRIGI